ncbi:MAG: hypothetical protein HY922_16280 [Elusimicrobia bacterium]|nr:hypothetical protein [Elusimicrobiota bacterium]
MKAINKAWAISALALAACLVPCRAFAGVNMVFDIMPGNFLNSSNLTGFNVSKSYYGGWYSYSYTDTVNSGMSWSPTTKIGVGIEMPFAYLDLTGGAGGFVGAFYGPLYFGDAALKFKLGRVVTLGPHLSVVNIRPQWTGISSDSGDVSIEPGTGPMLGVVFNVGKTCSFQASLDYLAMPPLKVTTHHGWVANRNELDFSGLMVQLGVAFRLFRGGDGDYY